MSATNFGSSGTRPGRDEMSMSDDPHIVARACDACRRMKIRCIGKETPPCKRCRSQALQCTFEMGARKLSTAQPEAGFSDPASDRLQAVEQRLKEVTERVETRVGGLDRKLDSLLQHLQGRGLPTMPPLSEDFTDSFASLPPETEREPSRPSVVGTAYPHHVNMSAIPPTVSPSTARSTWPIPEHLETVEEPDDPLHEMKELNPYRSLNKHQLDRDDTLTAASEAISPLRSGPKRRRTVESLSPMRSAAIVGNPVQRGWCTVIEARALFDSFFTHAHCFMPVFDPAYDTFESLSTRSPLCFTVILFITSAVQSSLAPSQHNEELCGRAYESAKELIGQSLLAHSSDLETLQALVVFASWSDQPWRLGCHAISIALHMRLYRCLPVLGKREDSEMPNNASTEEDRRLLAGARVWVAVLKLVYEMSFNNGLPLPISDALRESSGRHARDLVNHPSSTLHDSRCVVSLEMLQAREPIYTSHLSPEPRAPEDLDSMLREVNDKIRDRKQYWEKYYKSIGLTIDDFLVKELRSQEAYAIMYANSCAWVGVHNKDDVDRMSRQRKQLVAAAMRAASFLVQSIGSGSQMKDSEFGNRYFHLGIISTARYLIRMCELLPEICDLHQISNDLELLFIKLPQYALPELSSGLRKALSHARASGVLPPHTVDTTSESAPVHWPEPSPAKSTPAGQLDISILNQLFPPSVTTSLLDTGSQAPPFDWTSADWTNFDGDLPWLNDLSFDRTDQIGTTSDMMLHLPDVNEQGDSYQWLAQ